MDGWTLAECLRAAGQVTARIIIVSANANELRPLSHAAYHDGVIAKPVNLASLLELIGAQLGLGWTDRPNGPPGNKTADIQHLALSPEQAERLRSLALIGYVRGIRDLLDELEAEDATVGPAVAKLRMLLSQFRLDEFMAVLDGMPASTA